jgi:hypothetical protein
MRTEKSRLRRALMRLQEQMRHMRHSALPVQVKRLNQILYRCAASAEKQNDN